MRVGILYRTFCAFMSLRLDGIKLMAAMMIVAAVSGCGGGKKQTRVRVPSPPTVTAESRRPSGTERPSTRERINEEESVANPELQSYGHTKPIYIETGVASWYGPPYHNRNAANGQPFDMNMITAAHKTLPLNSVIRVT